MKKSLLALALAASCAPAFAADNSSTQPQELTGDAKTACQVILCLSSGKRPDQCDPPIRRYFEIKAKHWDDTLQKRRDFLHLCPASNQNQQMSQLTDAIANGAGRCDAASLNIENKSWYTDGGGDIYTNVSNTLPGYCSAYLNNPLTRLSDVTPKYVGTPENGGFWADPDNYAAALAQYQKEQQEKQDQMNN